jgi:predicted lipoprotein with Yx(FWY)xxD motif
MFSMRFTAVGAVSALAALTLTACGSSSTSKSAGSAAQSPAASSPSASSSSSSAYGGYGSSSTTTASHASAGGATGSVPPATSGPAKVELHGSRFGPILVAADGRTLYLWQKDKGGKSACAGACAKVWPPLVTHGRPQAGAGVSAARLGSAPRADGTVQVTYNGHPLYYFTGDASAGQTNGEGSPAYGSLWDVVSTAGAPVSPESTAGSSSSSVAGY